MLEMSQRPVCRPNERVSRVVAGGKAGSLAAVKVGSQSGRSPRMEDFQCPAHSLLAVRPEEAVFLGGSNVRKDDEKMPIAKTGESWEKLLSPGTPIATRNRHEGSNLCRGLRPGTVSNRPALPTLGPAAWGDGKGQRHGTTA